MSVVIAGLCGVVLWFAVRMWRLADRQHRHLVALYNRPTRNARMAAHYVAVPTESGGITRFWSDDWRDVVEMSAFTQTRAVLDNRWGC